MHHGDGAGIVHAPSFESRHQWDRVDEKEMDGVKEEPISFDISTYILFTVFVKTTD